VTTSYQINFTDPNSDPGNKDTFSLQPFTTNGPISPSNATLDPLATSMTTSLLFHGKGAPNWGERLQENILHLLENFASETPPIVPTLGQLWYYQSPSNTADSALMVYRGTNWDSPMGWLRTVNGTVVTSDNTATVIASLTLNDNTTYVIDAYVACMRNDGTDQAGYRRTGTFYRSGGNTIQVGSTELLLTSESDAALNVDFHTSGNDVRIRGTGINSETYRWNATMTFLNVSQ